MTTRLLGKNEILAVTLWSITYGPKLIVPVVLIQSSKEPFQNQNEFTLCLRFMILIFLAENAMSYFRGFFEHSDVGDTFKMFVSGSLCR